MSATIIENLLSNKLTAGINFYYSISANLHVQFNGFINEQLSIIKNSYSLQLPKGFEYSRKLYRSFSIDPTKHRPSSEALWRRIKKGLDFPLVNPFVDLTNLLSLKYQVCYGLYDLAKVGSEIEITQGIKGDNYPGIRKEIINLEGKILLKDTMGPFGNPSSDSLRASTADTSKDLLQVLFFNKDDPQKNHILTETVYCFKRFFHIGDINSYML